ncbi:MAG: OmpH/Skp family outer membrane protein [Vulcanimicrobiaceae bacterium]
MACLLAACGTSSPVGLVNVSRITANWPAYNAAQQSLSAAEEALVKSKVGKQQKIRQAVALQVKYATIERNLSNQVRDAAAKIASKQHLTLVLTREGVGYGGVSITAQVEKALGIVEKPSPSPSS